MSNHNISTSTGVSLASQKEGIDATVKRMLNTEGAPYSPEAEILIENQAAYYAEELILEAARLARRENLQQIGTAHVDEAKKRLLSIDRRSWFKRLCGGFGGALLGIGAAPFIALGAGSATPTPLVLVGGLTLIGGSILLMYGVRN